MSGQNQLYNDIVLGAQSVSVLISRVFHIYNACLDDLFSGVAKAHMSGDDIDDGTTLSNPPLEKDRIMDLVEALYGRWGSLMDQSGWVL